MRVKPHIHNSGSFASSRRDNEKVMKNKILFLLVVFTVFAAAVILTRNADAQIITPGKVSADDMTAAAFQHIKQAVTPR